MSQGALFTDRGLRQLRRLLGTLAHPVALEVSGPAGDPFVAQFEAVAAAFCRAAGPVLGWHRGGTDGWPRLRLLDEAGRPYGIGFAGSVAGYQLQGLVAGIRAAAAQQGGGELSEWALVVFTAPTCPHCPRLVVAAQAWILASPSPPLCTWAVDAGAIPAWAERAGVTWVPATALERGAQVVAVIDQPLPIDAWRNRLEAEIAKQEGGR
ncbi:MAG: hypothetical protein K6U14_03890 [Firmicutes bacterium]|nr:hypothetical protein [Alicyclobacillaceae bacterium]MCL6496763.1 hypothetical protein [Bacillota bacterium]